MIKPNEAKRVRHKVRGTEYTIIGVGRAQGEILDDDPVVLYRDDNDGGLWVRHQAEFSDGRFEYITPARAEAQDEDTPCTDCGDTGVTHQTERRCSCQEAEAQDEGVAGEASAYRVRMISNDPAEWVLMHPEKALDFLSRKGWESQPLYAHPSTTPAADADRLRIAVEALEATKNRVQEWPIGDYETCMCGSPVASHGMGDGHSPVSQGDYAINMIVEAINEALAALKSTVAKENNNVSTN